MVCLTSRIITFCSCSTLSRIFILEGLFSICYAALAFFIIPAFPKDATFLTKEERELLLQRLEEERGNEKVSMRDINWVGILWNWKVWLA